MRKGYIFLKGFLKNVLVFLIGGLSGTLIMFLFLIKPALERVADKAGLGIIALGPVLIIIYTIFSVIAGGSLAVFGFNIIKLIRKKKKK